MDRQLQQKMETAIWIGKSLFERGKTAGSSANLSFLHDGVLYISGSGTCFGFLKPEDFSCVAPATGKLLGGVKPSKELPLHQHLYQKSDTIQAVIHTHSFYATLWSCLPHPNSADVIPSHTPYLKMKLGTVGLIPYAKPGSQELFRLFAER